MVEVAPIVDGITDLLSRWAADNDFARDKCGSLNRNAVNVRVNAPEGQILLTFATKEKFVIQLTVDMAEVIRDHKSAIDTLVMRVVGAINDARKHTHQVQSGLILPDHVLPGVTSEAIN